MGGRQETDGNQEGGIDGKRECRDVKENEVVVILWRDEEDRTKIFVALVGMSFVVKIYFATNLGEIDGCLQRMLLGESLGGRNAVVMEWLGERLLGLGLQLGGIASSVAVAKVLASEKAGIAVAQCCIVLRCKHIVA